MNEIIDPNGSPRDLVHSLHRNADMFSCAVISIIMAIEPYLDPNDYADCLKAYDEAFS